MNQEVDYLSYKILYIQLESQTINRSFYHFFFEFFFDASVTEAATGGFLLKKMLLKFLKDSQRTPVPLQPY